MKLHLEMYEKEPEQGCFMMSQGKTASKNEKEPGQGCFMMSQGKTAFGNDKEPGQCCFMMSCVKLHLEMYEKEAWVGLLQDESI